MLLNDTSEEAIAHVDSFKAGRVAVRPQKKGVTDKAMTVNYCLGNRGLPMKKGKTEHRWTENQIKYNIGNKRIMDCIPIARHSDRDFEPLYSSFGKLGYF